MVESIIPYGKLDADSFEAPGQLKQHLVDTAEEYGFTVDVTEMDYPGITAPTGDHLEFDPRYVEDNALTYLWPGLMEDKIEARISHLQGFYEDEHFGLEELQQKELLSDRLDSERQRMYEEQRKLVQQAEDGGMSRDEAVEQIEELGEEIEAIDQRLNLVSNGAVSQANLYMVNDLADENDPVRVIAVDAYNPAHYEKDREKLEGFFEQHFDMYPWLAADAREDVVDEIEAINQELERRAENFEL